MADGVGNRLREARGRRKLGLQEVEEATKIRGRYLQAIEDEDWDQLPGDTYARAFIRTYAALVGLDGERLAEEQRRDQGAARPGERLPRVDPRPRPVTRGHRRRVPSWVVTAAVLALVVAVLVAVLLSGGGEDGPEGANGPSVGQARGLSGGREAEGQSAAPRGHSIELTASGEVWVCLLDGTGAALIDSQILSPGETAGPFRSDSFRLALGNGAVKMTVDGQQPRVPHPSNPIGFEVDSSGAVRELPEGERPTCT